MKGFYNYIVEKEGEEEHHASVIPLTGFSPISHMGHAKDLGSALKKLPGKKHVGISSKSDLYSDKERGDILHKQWGDKEMKHHVVKSAGETIAHAYHSLPKNGKKHLHLLVGHDRKDFAHGLKKSLEAGKIKEMGSHKWDHIHIHHPADSERTHGMSGTNMRNAADKGNIKEFHRHLGKMFTADEAKKHMAKFQKGIQSGSIKVKRAGSKSVVKENFFKAIFITGGPGSGKDIIIRECITDDRVVEMTSVQAFDYLMDKQSLSEQTKDLRRESIRNRQPLIINGRADDYTRMITVKEELEELGYDTLMVFVDTTNEASQSRNEKLSKMIAESVRYDKWLQSQASKKTYVQHFENFILFDNSASLSEIEESVTDTYHIINMFLEHRSYSETAISWLERNGKIDINESFNLIFEEENDKKNSKSIQKQTIVKYNPNYRAKSPADIKPDNRAGANPPGQTDQIKGDTFPRKDPNGKGHSGGAWSGTYSTEETKQKISFKSLPKESNFSQDRDKLKKKKSGDSNVSEPRIGRPSGFSQEYDTRAGGQSAAAGAGLGQNLYGENLGPTASNDDVVNFAGQPRGVSVNPLDSQQPPKKKKTFKEFYGFQNDDESGVGGTLGGADNKEQMDSYRDPNRNVIIQTKKKKKQEK